MAIGNHNNIEEMLTKLGLAFNQKTYVCNHVFTDEAPILLVVKEDNCIMCLCGAIHGQNGSDYKVVGLGHLLQRDPSLNRALAIDNNFEAERTAIGKDWMITSLIPQ